METKKSTSKNYLQLYLETLNEKELKSYHIAKDHLGTSFQLERSNGFLKWWKSNQENK
jgi:hypothetical protein